MSDSRQRPEQLQALQRWQSSQLEEARIAKVQLEVEAAERLSALSRIQDEIDELQSLAREQTRTDAPLNPEALLRMTAFSGLQQQRLHGAEDVHRAAARRAEDAQVFVLHLFQQLSLVERLIDRRHDAAQAERQRQSQKELDEGALSRAPHNDGT
jgi:hypothetical protein